MLPMNNQAHVRQIQSHAKSVRTDDYVRGGFKPTGESPKQHVSIVGGAQSRMKERQIVAPRPKTLLELFADLHCGHKQHCPSGRHDTKKRADHRIPALVRHAVQTRQRNVRSINASHNDPSVRNSKRFKNAPLTLKTCRRCESKYRRIAQSLPHRPQSSIVRAEIHSPAINAVRFINDEVAWPRACDLLDFGLAYHLRIEPLGSTE